MAGVLLARGRAKEALDQARILAESPSMMARFAGHTMMGRALVAMDRVDEAEKELASAREALVLVPRTMRIACGHIRRPARRNSALTKKSAEGVALMKEIEEQLRASPGPDARSQALIQLDSIARRARETDEWALAELTAQANDSTGPQLRRWLLRHGLAAEHQGNSSKAMQQYNVAEKLWSEADKDLPELQILRKKTLIRANGTSPVSSGIYLKRVREHPEASASQEKLRPQFRSIARGCAEIRTLPW